MSFLQHNPDVFREHLLATRPWLLVVNALISVVLGLLIAGDTGRRVYFAIATLFARAPRIVPTIATLSFALMLSGGAGIVSLRTVTWFGFYPFRWFPYGPQVGSGLGADLPRPEGPSSRHWPTRFSVELSAGAVLRLYDILAIVVALGVLAYVTVRFQRGRRGLESRATASSLERAATLGVDVIKESKNPWQLAGVMSGAAGILTIAQRSTAPEVGLDMTALTLVLAAVVLARTTSPALALLASIALSVLQQGMFWNFGSQLPFQGSLVVIIGVALLLQRRRASRADEASESVFTTAPEPPPVPPRVRTLPGVHGMLRGTTAVVVLVLVLYPLFTAPRQLSLGIGVLGSMIVGLSLLVISGWGGQVSLGQLALAAVGAWVAAIAGGVWGVPMLLAALLGGVAGAAVAPLIGLPALRLPGPFVAIMTLASSIAVPAILLGPELLGRALPEDLQRPVMLGFDFASDRAFYWLALLFVAGATAVVSGLRRSRLRRALIASRDNNPAAASFGINVLRLRLEAFAVSGFIAGVGGAVIAFANRGVQPDSFSATNSVVLFLVVVIGGLGAVSGPLIGGAAFSVVQFIGAAATNLLNGLGTIVVLAVRPGGLASLVVGLRDAAIRVIAHLQGHDLIRYATSGTKQRVAIADRPGQAPPVPVTYRLVGDGYAPVEGTRLRRVEGIQSNVPADLERAAAAEAEGLPDSRTPLLSVHRLDVAYGGAVAVEGVSLDLAAGEVLAVVGLNGAGKTSLLRAIAGLEPAHHGNVRFDGADVTTWFPHVRAGLGDGLRAGRVRGPRRAHRPREHARHRRGHRRDRRDVPPVPRAGGAARHLGRQPLRRRAAGPRDRPGHPPPATAPAHRRAVARLVARGPGDRARAHRRPRGRRDRRRDRRAVHQLGDVHRGPGPVPRERAGPVPRPGPGATRAPRAVRLGGVRRRQCQRGRLRGGPCPATRARSGRTHPVRPGGDGRLRLRHGRRSRELRRPSGRGRRACSGPTGRARRACSTASREPFPCVPGRWRWRART